MVFTVNGNASTASFEYTLSDGNGGADSAIVTVVVGKTLNDGNGKDCFSGTTGDDVLNGGNENDILLGLAGEKLYQILKFLYIHFPHLPTAPFHVLLKGAVVGIIKRLAVAEAA